MTLAITAFIFVVLTCFFLIQMLCLYWIMDLGADGMLQLEQKDKEPQTIEDFPMVSILLAARNEELLIERSLKSIHELDYPKEKIEVLIGNDDSTDKTVALVEQFIKGKPEFKLIHITKIMGKGRGKANVLAHLAHEAKGKYFFITDVDVKLPKLWVKELLSEFRPHIGIVSGTTMCERGKLFATMQSIDWLHFMGYIKAFAKVGISCTTVGNNMAVSAQAYWETGGYENIDFSITEDYKLFKEVTDRGWGWATNLSPNSLGLAWYIPDIVEMLHQRKRWLIGAKELPLNWKLMIVLYGLFLPALFLLFLISPTLAFGVWFFKTMAQIVFITTLSAKTGVKPFSFLHLLIYELYVVLNTSATALFYFLPIPSVWKGRKYNAVYLRD